jgi:hypothetical protein
VSNSPKYQVRACFDDDELVWQVRVAGVPGVVEECTARSVGDAARGHIARELGVPMDAVEVEIQFDGPDAELP